MPNMKRCVAQVSLSGPWGVEHLQPGMEVDFARVLAPARESVAAKGTEGTDGYRPAIAGKPAFTVADAVAGREDWFEDVAPAAKASRTSITAAPVALTDQE